MAKPEAAFRTKFKQLIRRYRPYSIENLLCTPGFPDIVCTKGVIELKVLPKWPVRETTPLRIDHFTKEQRRFALDWEAAGGKYWLVVKVAGETFIFGPKVAAELVGEMTREEMKHQALAHFESWPSAEQVCAHIY